MKTATVTWISYYNYGTFLQAYALQKTILSLGHSNVILNDSKILKDYNDLIAIQNTVHNTNDSRQKRKKAYNFFYKGLRKIKRIVFSTSRHRISVSEQEITASNELNNRISLEKDKEFKKFIEEDLTVSLPFDKNSFSNINNEYDAFICGSDQIWSANSWEIRPYYYLSFVNDNKKKIAYAPSVNSRNIPLYAKNIIKKLLSSFDFISLREENLEFQALTHKPSCIVADPTFLLNKSQWSDFADKTNVKSKYLFCYFLDAGNDYQNYAEQVASELNLKIIIISNHSYFYNSAYLYDSGIGPKEFIGLLLNAECVLSDSYHATILSINFNKKFVAFKRNKNNNSYYGNNRMTTAFEKYGINYSLVEDANFSCKHIFDSYTSDINNHIETYRAYSLNVLSSALNN